MSGGAVVDAEARPKRMTVPEVDPTAIVTAVPNAALVVAADGRIVAANREADELFGAAVAGRMIEELVPEGSRAGHRAAREQAGTDHRRPMGIGLELAARRADGREIPVEISLSGLETPAGTATLAIVVDVSDRRRRIETLSRQATTDPLTGLGNRLALRAALIVRFGGSAEARPLVALAIDLDELTSANDSYGHEGGDVLLRAFAARLRSAVRAGDVVVRVGGDEFVVLCDGPLSIGRSIAQRLVGPGPASELPVRMRGLRLSASVGIAARQPDERPRALLRRADEALYAAKAAGRGQIVEAS